MDVKVRERSANFDEEILDVLKENNVSLRKIEIQLK